jgi:hypothetical protein
MTNTVAGFNATFKHVYEKWYREAIGATGQLTLMPDEDNDRGQELPQWKKETVTAMSRQRAEVQTTIDECGDGSWEGVLLVGSNFIVRLHAPSFFGAAFKLHMAIKNYERDLEEA